MTHTSMYRMKGLATIAEFLAQTRPEIAERTDTWLQDVLKPDETMPDVELLLELVQRKCEQGREQLREKDGRLSRTLTALDMARRVRGRAAEKLRGVLIHGRELLDGCTRKSAAPARFRGRISQRWHKAYLQAEAFLIKLRDPFFRPVALPGLLDYPKADLDEALVESLEEVEQASEKVRVAEQKVHAARRRLKKGQDETARIHRWARQLAEVLIFLADAPELADKMPPTLREEAAQKNRRRRKKKVEPAESLESGPSLDLRADTSVESGPVSTLQPHTSEKSGPASSLQPETSERSGPATNLQPETSTESGPASSLQPETSTESGPASSLQMPLRLSGGNRQPAPPARGVTTGERGPVTPGTPRETAETPVDGPLNAAVVRRNNDVCRVHVGALRGNRRRSRSVRVSDRAKRWLLAPSGGDDRRSGGPEPTENGGFQPPRPWKAKILALFGR